jgi:hypothetical protein
VTESLSLPTARIEVVEEGDPDGITDAVLTLVADHHSADA